MSQPLDYCSPSVTEAKPRSARGPLLLSYLAVLAFVVPYLVNATFGTSNLIFDGRFSASDIDTGWTISAMFVSALTGMLALIGALSATACMGSLSKRVAIRELSLVVAMIIDGCIVCAIVVRTFLALGAVN